MPSKKNPSDIQVGSGLAGQGSVSVTSLTFSSSSLGGNVSASEVSNETPISLSGGNVQEHINQAALQALTKLPNVLGSSTNPVNSGLVDTSPVTVVGRYGSSAIAANLYEGTTVNLEGVVFPADRGILALEVDGSEIAALDLSKIFVEGDPEDTSVPSRKLGQVDYVAESNPVASVNGLPQINLTKRLPVQDLYSGGEYEDFPESVFAQQLSTFNLDVTHPANSARSYDIIHYRSRRDYDAKATGRKYGQTSIPTSSALPLYVDDVAATPLINSFTLAATNPAGGTRHVSGVQCYSSADTFNTAFNVTDMFNTSYLESGISIELQAGRVEDQVNLVYTSYDQGSPTAGQTAVFASSISLPTTRALEVRPQLRARNPFGQESTFNTASPNRVLLHGTTLDVRGSVSPSRLTSESFGDESVRYVSANGLMEPDGQGSLFDATSSLVAGQAQVRPASTGSDLSLVLGGELGYPQTDYSTGYHPQGNPDYSSFSGEASYHRSFNMGGPYREGRIRLVGASVSSNLFEDFAWDADLNVASNGYGHPEGLKILVGSDPNSAPNLDLGKSYTLGGALISVQIENANSVVVTFQLDQAPQKSPEGFYPVKTSVTWTGVSGTSIVLYQIELLPAQ